MGLRLAVILLGVGIPLTTACSDHAVGPPPPTVCTSTAAGGTVSLGVAACTAVDVAGGSDVVHFPANASAAESTEYLIVAQSAAGTSGQSSPYVLQGAAGAAMTARETLHPLAVALGRSSTAIQFDRHLRWMASTHAYPAVPVSDRVMPTAARALTPVVAASVPPVIGDRRLFKVCANLSCAKLDTVVARARAVGSHIAIYVDSLAPTPGMDSVSLDSLSHIFDARLFALDTAAFGGVSDIDNNGVVIVLMSGVVNALVSSAQCQASGFVAGFFFGGDLDPVFRSQFNSGEIFYSIVADPSGTLSCAHSTSQVLNLTPITFVHEFQHMISFVQHVLVLHGSPEEGWLDEGLSKYAEELAGRSYLPADPQAFSNFVIGDVFDAYQYLAAPSSSPLLIPEDTGSLAEIGASWLFTRYLVDRYGAKLPRKLHGTTAVGSAAVSSQTTQSFKTLLTNWGLANWVSDLPGLSAPPDLRYSSWQFRTTFAALNSQDPKDFPLSFPLVPIADGGSVVSSSGTVTSGSGAYVRVFQPPLGAAFSLHFTRDGSTALPAALVPRLDVIRIR
jgi:hypothetical protein